MEKCEVLFLMPARKTGGIKDTIEEFKRGLRKEISKHKVRQWPVYIQPSHQAPAQTKGRAQVSIPSLCNQRPPPPDRETTGRCTPDIQEAMGYRERIQVHQADMAPYMQSKLRCPPTLVLSGRNRLQSLVFGQRYYNKAVKAGVLRKQAEKTHVVLRTFMFMIMDVAEKILAMDGVGV